MLLLFDKIFCNFAAIKELASAPLPHCVFGHTDRLKNP